PQLPDFDALVAEAIAALPAPEPGKSVTAEDVKPLLEQMVKAAVAELPAPEAPQLPDVDALVAEAVAALPAPEPGKSITAEDVTPLLEQMVKAAVAALPVPEAPQLPDVDALVANAVGALPAPEPGKSVTAEDVKPLLEQMVKAAVVELPMLETPQLPDINALVAEAVAALPAPEPGKSVTAEDVKPLLEQMVKAAVAELPAPEAPQLPDINALVADAFAALPALEPTKGGDGRDALQLEVMPFIDEEKSYPRGSYATHSGGLWRAYEKTHGMRGWECLVDGVLGIDVSSTDERNFTVTVTRASGAAETKAFSIPAMIYRGVFKSGEAYQAGDTVTWGGSMWHCDQDSTDKPGENGSKGWTLATKRGRDGRDKT
ncbi:phage gp6-like head-tail connector protein, partial [Obesumbacterium proteus]|uniref:phage gp6-like head-tail connector protein n=1 Tax=Obesumbacterium proteus TaxID=82983 RepID=UPI000B11BE20